MLVLGPVNQNPTSQIRRPQAAASPSHAQDYADRSGHVPAAHGSAELRLLAPTLNLKNLAALIAPLEPYRPQLWKLNALHAGYAA